MTTTPFLGDRACGPWFRVLSLAAPCQGESAEADYASILPAALSAAGRSRPLVVAWLCRGHGSPLELVTNAGLVAALPGPPGGSQPLIFPPGGRGAPAPRDWLSTCEGLVWASCPGRQVPAPGPGARLEPERGPGRQGRFESALTALQGRAFGWLVVAEPTDLLARELAGLRTQLNVLRRQDEESARLGVERAQRRLAELDAFQEAGLWNVRVLVGAASPAELALVAPVLVGSAELGCHGYRLGGAEGATVLAEALLAEAGDDRSGGHAPFHATAGVLAALAGLPRREVPGLRMADPGHFDLTSETDATPPGPGVRGPSAHGPHLPAAVTLGVVLDGLDRPVGEFRVPLATLNRHAFVTGATGAGKSQTVRHLLEQLTGAGLAWLAIEPVKAEYPGMAARLAGFGEAGGLTVINPADPGTVPFSVNPLAPEPGFPVQAHIDLVRALFLAAFDAAEPFPQVMSQALERVYAEAGWDAVTGAAVPGAATPPSVPTLAELQRAAIAVIEDVGYGRELEADVRGFVDVRLRSLRAGSAGRFFEGGHPADIGGLLRRNVVLAIEDVANDEDKAFLMGTLIIRIVEHLRLRARQGQRPGLRHVLVIEEAHRLLRARSGERAGAHAVELFAGLLAEIRAYGEGLVIAEQIPAKLIGDVVKNTALKVVHRLPARDDRDLVGAAMNLDEGQSRHVVSLPPGVAAVFADGMDRPVRVRVPFGGDREGVLPGPPAPILGRRSPACGPLCTRDRPCTQLELRRGELAACSPEPGGAWLRLWAQTLVLAFLTGRGLPAAPAPLRQHWAGTGARVRECALASVVEAAVRARASALRHSYAPAALAASVTDACLRVLGGRADAGERPGATWVIPQLRWLHEAERLCPLEGTVPDPGHRAPPLDFDLPGLADWPGIRVGQRVRVLRRHPASMDLPRNQVIAWTALLGDDDHAGFADDLAVAGVGLDRRAQLSHAAAMMEVGHWLEPVLSWPRRFLAGTEPGWPAAPPADGAVPQRAPLPARARGAAG